MAEKQPYDVHWSKWPDYLTPDLERHFKRTGEISLVATITERVQPGVVYTTFHNPETGANVVTTEHSDWATNCPEYKVTAVQIAPATHRSNWQHGFDENAKLQGQILETETTE